MAFDPNQQAPLPPAPNPQTLTEDQIRAMRGDLSAGPAPVAPPAPAPAAPAPAAAPEPALNIPAKPIFDADEPAFSPNTTTQMASVDDLVAQHGSKGKMLWIIGSVVGVIALGLVGYFVVYPMIAGEPTEPAAPATPPAAVTPTPPAAPAHVSAFVNNPLARINETMTATLSKAAVNDLLNKHAQTVGAGTTEIIITTSAGAPLPFSEFVQALAPSFTEGVKSGTLFADDFTAYLFKDKNGAWPGYVAQLRPDASDEGIRAWFASLEKSTLSEFFIVSPGTMSAFKEGSINGKYPDRYSTGSTAGASLGYLILPEQRKVVISSSFDGLKEAIRLMGL